MRELLDVQLRTSSVEATRAIGGALAEALASLPREAATLICLDGELGAGKTVLVGGLLSALGFTGTVKSPTFALLETYELADRELHHLDLYRLKNAGELESLGLQDLFRPAAVLLIEWAERAAAALPRPDLAIRIDYADDPNVRFFRLSAYSETGVALADSTVS